MTELTEAHCNEIVLQIFADVLSVGPVIQSCYQHGSLVKKTFRLGNSDIVDGLVVVDDSALVSVHSLGKLLRGLVSACSTLSELSIPTHPFQYYFKSELTSRYPSLLVAIWATDSTSRLIHGKDIRSEIKASDSSKRITNYLVLTSIRSFQTLVRRTTSKDLQLSRRSDTFREFDRYRKLLPILACHASGLYVEQSDADACLCQLFPSLNMQVLKDFDALRYDLMDQNVRLLKRIFERILSWFFDIYEAISNSSVNLV